MSLEANEAWFRDQVNVDGAPLLGARWTLRTLADVTPRQVRWLVPGLIPLRTLTLVAGVGGLGKTTWLLAQAATLSRAGHDCVIVSFEDTAAEIIRPRVEAANGDLTRVHEMVLVEAGDIDTVQLPRDLDELRLLVRSVEARLVIVDPIVAAIETSLDAHKDQHVRSVLAQLVKIAEEEDAAVAIVGHLNKAPSTEAYLRVANSVAFWNASRSVVLITEDSGDDDTLRLVAQRKANWSRVRPVERHRLEEIVLLDSVDPETGSPIVTSRMVFVEIADDVDGADVLGPRRATKTETAEQLLDLLLGDGDWHESEPMKQVLDMAGFPERTAQRAAKDVGVETERRGFPSVTWWRLPVAPDLSPTVGATVAMAQPSHSETSTDPVAPSSQSRQTASDSERARLFDQIYPRRGGTLDG